MHLGFDGGAPPVAARGWLGLALTLALLCACRDPDPTGDPDGGASAPCPVHPNVAVDDVDGTTVCVVSGNLEEDLTLDADHVWLLQGRVSVGRDGDPGCQQVDVPDSSVTLTLEPGTTVYADTSLDSSLEILRGARIDAVGTAEAPIVFTSSKREGSQAPGDWGGVQIDGRARIHQNEVPRREETGGCFGGELDDDDSGQLAYVRIEFGGKSYGIDDQKGLSLQGVGSRTVVHHVQVHGSQDDCLNVYGGTVKLHHVVVSDCGDDGLDWSLGWRGSASHVVIRQAEGIGDRGIEADNAMDDTAEDPPRPFSSPTLTSFTVVGVSSDVHSAITLRRGTMATLSDFLVTGFEDASLQVDGWLSVRHVQEGHILVRESWLQGGTPVKQRPICNDPGDDPSDEAPDGTPMEPCPLSGIDAGRADVTATMVTDPEHHNRTGRGLFELEDPYGAEPSFKGVGKAATRGAIPDEDWTRGWTAYPVVDL